MRRILPLVLFLAAALLGGAAPASAAAAPYCGITWGSLAKSAGGPNPGLAQLTNVRTGQHDCWDRVVFDFGGSAANYHVEYTDQPILTQSKGEPLTIAGGAKLNLTLLEHAEGYPHLPKARVAVVTAYRTLRDVVYGGTFEGNTTFGVGVRARLPFRVFTLPGPASGQSRIVLDVAHQWSQ
jgi:hypothetical protein